LFYPAVYTFRYFSSVLVDVQDIAYDSVHQELVLLISLYYLV